MLDATTCEVDLSATTEGLFNYNCSANKQGVAATTGSRMSTVGTPGTERAIAVLQHQFTDQAMDFVFIADSDNFASANATDFRSAVHDSIRDAYLSDDFICGIST